MAIRNINTIQNPNDLSYILSYTNNFMYESLANLGQRFSIKGDSVKSSFFTTLSVCSKDADDFIDDNGNKIDLISKISLIDNNIYLQFFNINDINTPLYTELLDYTINNLVTTDAPLKLNTKINGIDYYKENLYIFVNDSENILYIASLGCDNDMGIVELNIDAYNINTNKLVKSLKLIDTNDSDHYYLYYLYDELRKDNDTDTDYVIYKYYINKKTVDILYNNFETLALSLYQLTVKEYYNEYKTLNITDIFNEILQLGFINALPNENNDPIKVEYNKEVNGFYVNGPEASELNSILTFFYNQLIYMYDYMFEYYCNYIYKLDNNQLNKYILYRIFNKSFTDSGIEDLSLFEMYIPVNYEFNYYHKDNDAFYIYSNETPINIFYTINTINQDYINNLYNGLNIGNNSIILVPHKSLEKVTLYKFTINYNISNSTIINSIVVSNLYSTPYILDDYWVINDIKTPYKAIGKDANNPNIIIVHTKNVSLKNNNYTNSDFDILTTINSDLLNSISWKRETVKTNLFNYIDTSDKTLIKSKEYYSYVLIPSDINITSDKSTLVEQLKGSLIINLSDINNVIADTKNTISNISEKDQIKEVLGNDSFITSFWVFDNYSYCFTNIKNPSDISNALTLSNLNNINSIIYNQTKTEITKQLTDFDLSNTKFTYAVFNTGYVVTKSVLSDITYTYAVLYNKNISNLSLSEWETSPTNTFNNPYIFEIKYVDNVNENGISNSKHFILPNDSNDLKINVNNILSLYKLHGIGLSNYKNYTYEYIPSLNIPLFNFGEVFSMDINNLNKCNINVLDKNGYIYYSYIGSSNTIENKSILQFGTSNLNTSIGVDSLLYPDLITKFKEHDGVSINFKNIILNSNTVYFPNQINSKISKSSSTINYKYNYDIGDNGNACVDLYIKGYGHVNQYELSNPTPDTNIKLVKTFITSNNNYEYIKHVVIPINMIFAELKLNNISDNCNISSNMDIIEFSNNIKYIFTEYDKILNDYYIDLTINYTSVNNVIDNIEIINNKHQYSNLPCKVKYENN